MATLIWRRGGRGRPDDGGFPARHVRVRTDGAEARVQDDPREEVIAMWLETHRCAVDGCPNVAAFEVRQYDFDVAEGALVFVPDDDCPVICVEHAIENEQAARGERRPGSVVAYPYTNRARRTGFSVYLQPQPHYADAPTG